MENVCQDPDVYTLFFIENMLQPKAFKNEPPSHDTQDIKARIDHSNFFYTTDTQIGFSVEVKKQNKKQIQKKKII